MLLAENNRLRSWRPVLQGAPAYLEMTVRERICLLSFGRPVRAAMPERRLRALFAEAALQGVELSGATTQSPGRTDGLITAETWTGGGFSCSDVPLPRVAIVLDAALRPAERAFADWLADRHVTLVDDQAPDKLALAAVLQRHGLGRYVIPFAELSAATMRATLQDWVARRTPCVVKPANGARGGNIQFLLPDGFPLPGGGGWRVHKDAAALSVDAEAAVELVCRRIAGRIARRPFLVQRYVPTRTDDGRAFDLRVHVQRGASGGWGVTRGYARLGAAGFMVSNISRGGFQGALLPALAQRTIRTAETIAAELETAALSVARAIEADTGRTLSELGVDFAIDAQDALWVIEANAHPETSLHEQDRAIHTIGYAKYLAGGPVPDLAA